MKIAYIYRGLPGAGKSTAAHALGCDVYEIDDHLSGEGASYYSEGKVKRAARRHQADVSKAMARGRRKIAVANTHCKRWQYAWVESLAREHGYSVRVVDVYDGGLGDAALSTRCVHPVSARRVRLLRRAYER